LESNFIEELDNLAFKFKLDKPELLAEIKKWYNGYS